MNGATEEKVETELEEGEEGAIEDKESDSQDTTSQSNDVSGRYVITANNDENVRHYIVFVSNQEEVVSKEQCSTLAALVVSDWRKLAVELGLQDFEIECLEKECKTDKAGVGEATNMLRMWRVRIVTSQDGKDELF